MRERNEPFPQGVEKEASVAALLRVVTFMLICFVVALLFRPTPSPLATSSPVVREANIGGIEFRAQAPETESLDALLERDAPAHEIAQALARYYKTQQALRERTVSLHKGTARRTRHRTAV